jgi:hypothetical protein
MVVESIEEEEEEEDHLGGGGGDSGRGVKLITRFCMTEHLGMPPLTHRFPLQEAQSKRWDKFSFFFCLCVSVYRKTEIAGN